MHPLEVTHGDTAHVAQYVGEDENTSILQGFVSLVGDGTVCCLRHDLGPDRADVALVDGVHQRCRDEEVTIDANEVVPGEIACLRIALHCRVCSLELL